MSPSWSFVISCNFVSKSLCYTFVPSFVIKKKKNRGIAKLSPIPKLFESLLMDDLFHNVKSLISPYQHGFFKGRSITSNLLELTTKITSGFSKKMQTDVGYFDFSKAFDRINHFTMLKKLHVFGFDERYICWFRSYLTGRIQNVKFKEHISCPINVLSGVPQGSHLGPLLFLIYTTIYLMFWTI